MAGNGSPDLFDYGARIDTYRFPKGEDARRQWAEQANSGSVTQATNGENATELTVEVGIRTTSMTLAGLRDGPQRDRL